MKKVKFSVLMAVYYKEKPENLKLAFDSIINQTLEPNEIVLVEDGPLTQELENLISKYEKKITYLKIIKLEKNLGLGKALNEGLKYCSYEYVARMDSDDISYKNRFEKQINFLKENSSVDIVGSNIIEFDDETGIDISVRKVPLEMNQIISCLKKRNPMNHVTVIFKKKSIENVGGYKHCPYFEDYYLWARMLKNNCLFSNINENLVRVRAGLSMSNRRGNFNYIKCIIFFEKKLYKLGSINLFELIYNIFLRSLVSIIPNNLRYSFYQKKLREKND